MPKTNKELTAEIVVALLNSWGNSSHGSPIQPAQVPEIIGSIYNKLHSLKET